MSSSQHQLLSVLFSKWDKIKIIKVLAGFSCENFFVVIIKKNEFVGKFAAFTAKEFIFILLVVVGIKHD